MPLPIHLQELEEHDVHLAGEIPVDELELGVQDDTIRTPTSLKYDLNVQGMGDAILVQASI